MHGPLPQLRVTVNSRCGRACFFCRPSGESIAVGGHVDLNPDDLLAVVRGFAGYGLREVKLTGGDPALWAPLVETVRRLKVEAGLDHVEVISRHPRIGKLAPALTAAGADLVNVSLDTLKPGLHHEITGVDDLDEVLEAVRSCARQALACKVNTVVMAGVNDGEVDDLIAFCEAAGVRTLKLLDVIQDLDDGGESFARRLARLRAARLRDLYLPLGPVAERLRRRAVAEEGRTQGSLGHPMTVLRLASGLEVVVKDHRAGAWYGSICRSCRHYPCHDALMAVRLTADLRLQFCLLREDVAVDVRPLLREPAALAERIGEVLDVYRSARFVKKEVRSSLAAS
jgi:cyclic pyranopterin phosphate synthase